MDVKRILWHDGRPAHEVRSDKSNQMYLVKPSNDGFCFYDIKTDAGVLAKELSGKYTSAESAIKAVTKYLSQAPLSKTIRRDLNTKDREARATKNTDNKDKLQQGPNQ